MTTPTDPSQTTLGHCLKAGQIVAWFVLLFALTASGALPMLLQGLNLTRISQSTPHLPLVLMGMLVTSCSPTLAALFVVRFYPGAGGLRSVLQQLSLWRVPTIWYAIALIGPVLLLLAAKALNAVRLGTVPTEWMVLPSLSGPGGLPF